MQCHGVFLLPKEASLTQTSPAKAHLVRHPPVAAANWLARYYAASNQLPDSESRVDTTECAGPWIPWAPLWLILQVLMPSKRLPGQLAAYTFGQSDVVEYYLLVPILRPCEVSRSMSIGKDGLHQVLLHHAQGHAREMLRVEPDVRCYLQHSISLVI